MQCCVQYRGITNVNLSCKQARWCDFKGFPKVPSCFISSISVLLPNYLAVHLVVCLDRHLSPGRCIAVSVFSLCLYLQANWHSRSDSEQVHIW